MYLSIILLFEVGSTKDKRLHGISAAEEPVLPRDWVFWYLPVHVDHVGSVCFLLFDLDLLHWCFGLFVRSRSAWLRNGGLLVVVFVHGDAVRVIGVQRIDGVQCVSRDFAARLE